MFKCKICNNEYDKRVSFTNHITKTHKTNTKEYYDLYLKEESDNCCKTCGKETTFLGLNQGYRTHCSVSCLGKDVNINVLRSKSVKKTCLEKYGYTSCLLNKEIKEKTKQTNLKNHGVEYYTNRTKFIKTKNRNFYNFLISSNRLSELVKPLFNPENYTTVKKKYMFKCKKCDNIFEANLDNGTIPRCAVCFPPVLTYSNKEKEVYNFIKDIYKGEIIENNKNIIDPYELDIVIPDKKIAFEFDGLYWHSELNGKMKNYHFVKTIKAEEKNIQLFHIFENEWDEKQNIVKSIIKSKLNINTKFFARKCIIKEVCNIDKRKFLFDNHLQGDDNSKIKLGLYYDNELMALLTLGKPRFDKKYEYEIIRFCNKININIVGGFSKLLNYFVLNYKPKSIVTYADRRYSNGNLYSKNNFRSLGSTKCNYWYIKSNVVYNRMNFQKHSLRKLSNFDSNLTEWQNMQLNGYDRIWDCGNLKYELILN